MCGIHVIVGPSAREQRSQTILDLLSRRGPNSVGEYNLQLHAADKAEKGKGLHISFLSTVLSLRGQEVTIQPLRDSASDSILCWNGEAWRIEETPVRGNDTQAVFRMLLEASLPIVSPGQTQTPPGAVAKEMELSLSRQRVAEVIARIRGPFAFVFFDNRHRQLYFGRDCLGRRSLLKGRTAAGSLILSSVSDGDLATEWTEVDADGLYNLDLMNEDIAQFDKQCYANSGIGASCLRRIPWSRTTATNASKSTAVDSMSSFTELNRYLPDPMVSNPWPSSSSVLEIKSLLLESVKTRLQPKTPDIQASQNSSKLTIGILFSGGLDCSLLAHLAHEVLSTDMEIDLLNVAFENPRAAAAARSSSTQPSSNPKRLGILNTETLDEVSKPSAMASSFELCPDRRTGRTSHAELQQLHPGRTWRFIQIDVPYSEYLGHRATITSLIHPHDTEMDLSIASAFYFAARGTGFVREATSSLALNYTTSSPILLSGIGADELFAGYTRHATSFSRRGATGLLDELDLDLNRLGKRNLGRDDRVISHWGREARFPYLDEYLIEWAMKAPIWEKCGFLRANSEGSHDDADLEPGKLALRLLARDVGMTGVAKEKKRAIQFGAKTAKMETGKSKGTHKLG